MRVTLFVFPDRVWYSEACRVPTKALSATAECLDKAIEYVPSLLIGADRGKRSTEGAMWETLRPGEPLRIWIVGRKRFLPEDHELRVGSYIGRKHCPCQESD